MIESVNTDLSNIGIELKHEISVYVKDLNHAKLELDDKISGFDFNVDDRIEFLDVY